MKEMLFRSRWPVVACAAVFFFISPPLRSQALYSYVDDNGIRTFTNIPPTGQVRDLKVSGAAPALTEGGPASSRPKSSDFDPIIHKYAPQFRLDPSLVRSMISQESGFKPRAVSNKGARGLMQLMPSTAARLGVRNSFDPDENIRGGMQHMRNLLDMFNGDLELSLAAYNAGENLVQRIGRVPNFRETKDYVRSIKAKYGRQHIAPDEAGEKSASPMFRFVDQNGVLHLTNIPPIFRPENSGSASP